MLWVSASWELIRPCALLVGMIAYLATVLTICRLARGRLRIRTSFECLCIRWHIDVHKHDVKESQASRGNATFAYPVTSSGAWATALGLRWPWRLHHCLEIGVHTNDAAQLRG